MCLSSPRATIEFRTSIASTKISVAMRFSWLFEKTSLLRSVFANQLGDGTDSSVKQVAIIGELNQKPTTRLANRYFVSTCLYLPTYLAHPIQPPKDRPKFGFKRSARRRVMHTYHIMHPSTWLDLITDFCIIVLPSRTLITIMTP